MTAAENTDKSPLERHFPREDHVTPDTLLEGFLGWVAERGLTLYAAQEEALLELFSGKHVILATPTGSGKSLVALAACFKAMAEGGRAYYTAPIKALVSEKFFELCREAGPDNVGMMTGDATVNRDAPVVCCTAEVLANVALRQGERAEADHVVMDEFHFYSDRDRGVAWQIPLLCLPQSRFLLMSATLGDTRFFEEDLEKRTGVPVSLVRSSERPVPLEYEYRTTSLVETIQDLALQNRTPVYVVHFAQRAAVEQAQALTSLELAPRATRDRIREELRGFRFDTPFGKELRRYLEHGIGVHHAGLLPKYRLLVEKLAQQGLLAVISGTDTLGVGVNVPIRSVLFTQLCKYDGVETKVLTVRDFQQIAGRAGRRGFDTKGWVLAQAPEHVVENLGMQRKAEGDAKKLRKLHLRKPPERGYAHFDEVTFERLRTSDPEALRSRFQVSHAMILQLLARGPAGCRALRALIRACHEPEKTKRRHGRTAIQMLRSLAQSGVVELRPGDIVVNEALQEDFSLNQALSPFAVELVSVFEPESPSYALDVVSVIEATLEDPGAVLFRQTDIVKDRALARMKAEGLEYEERMAELEKIDRPKPLEELLEATLDTFRARHPWVGGETVRPKSVARDMIEQGIGFLGYVREYGLERSEGVLLRYLTDCYKALVQTVPERAKTPELLDFTGWLGHEVRRVDASLLDEWERLRDPSRPPRVADEEEAAYDLTRDRRAFIVAIRNAAWRVVRALARGEHAEASRLAGGAIAVDAIAEAMGRYREAHGTIRLDAAARAPREIDVDTTGARWSVTQTLLDPEEERDFCARFEVDLDASREAGDAVLTWVALGDR